MDKDEKLADARLLELLKQSPQKGMEEVIERYTPLVWSIVGRHFSNPEDIRECVNDVFYNFYCRREQIDLTKGSLGLYLSMTARSAAIDRYRRDLRQPESVPLYDVPGTDSMEEAASARMDMESALQKLDPQDAEIIRMKYYGGMTVSEIAAALKLPYETVKKRHQRSLKKLRLLLTIGLILLMAALTACAYLVLRHFGVVPGLGVTTGTEGQAYTLTRPVTVETEEGAYTVSVAMYLEGTLYLEIRPELPPEALERLEEAIESQDGYDGEASTHFMTISCGGETIKTPTGYDKYQGHFVVDLQAPPPEDGSIRIIFMGMEFDVPMERRDAGEPDDYPYAVGERGGLLAIPNRQEEGLIMELYALNSGEMPMAQYLIYDAHMQGKTDDITLSGADGTCCAASYWYGPATYVTETLSLWNFGDVEPGEYTLRVPYVYLMADLSEEPEGISVDLETCTWEDAAIPLPYGSVSLVSCESVTEDAVPERSLLDSGGWVFTMRWEPSGDIPLKFTSDSFILDVRMPQGRHAEGSNLPTNEIFSLGPMEEDGTFRFYFNVDRTLEWDFTQAVLLPKADSRLSYRWEHVFEIPVTIE